MFVSILDNISRASKEGIWKGQTNKLAEIESQKIVRPKPQSLRDKFGMLFDLKLDTF